MKSIFSLIALALLGSSQTYAFTLADSKDLCRIDQDQRVRTDRPEVGRLRATPDSKRGCTGFLVSDRCVLSAGHCLEQFHYMDFDLADSSASGVPAQALSYNHYEVDQIIAYRREGWGKDWAVITIKPNAETGLYPGEVQGHLPYTTQLPRWRAPIEVIGYGQSFHEPTRNYTQQGDQGRVRRVHTRDGLFNEKGRIKYQIDTTDGTSGGPIILLDTGEVIGVHANGGCNRLFSNAGVSIAVNTDFAQAIKQCLEK